MIGPAAFLLSLSALVTGDLVGDDPSHQTPRIYSKRPHVFIRSRPAVGAPWIGYLGLGGSVALASNEPIPSAGCKAFYTVKPVGFVCADAAATLDGDDPEVLALRALAPDFADAYPYATWEAREAPRYRGVPSVEAQRRREWAFEQHRRDVLALGRGELTSMPRLLAGVDVTPAGRSEPPELARAPRVQSGPDKLSHGAGVATVGEFDAGGRTWLITWDLSLVPKDRVAPHRRTEFHGIEGDTAIAFVRERARPRFVKDGSGVRRDGEWPRLTAIPVTGDSPEHIVAPDGSLVSRGEVTVALPARETPWGSAVIAPRVDASRVLPRHARPAGRGTWIEVSVHGGWLIAYEDTRPVFFTLAATGRGKPDRPGGFVPSATPGGVFRVMGKYLSETMAIGGSVHGEVPFVMPYEGSHAFHSAYWHDAWGEKVSMGCVNLSPLDAQRLFHWAEPPLPDGWHGASVAAGTGAATVVVIHG